MHCVVCVFVLTITHITGFRSLTHSIRSFVKVCVCLHAPYSGYWVTFVRIYTHFVQTHRVEYIFIFCRSNSRWIRRTIPRISVDLMKLLMKFVIFVFVFSRPVIYFDMKRWKKNQSRSKVYQIKSHHEFESECC